MRNVPEDQTIEIILHTPGGSMTAKMRSDLLIKYIENKIQLYDKNDIMSHNWIVIEFTPPQKLHDMINLSHNINYDKVRFQNIFIDYLYFFV